MSNKSMTDIAYDILTKKKRSIVFTKLWEDVSKTLKLPNDRIGQFYSDISLDSRFVSLKENKWDLKERRKYDESHIDIASLEMEEDVEEGETNQEEELDTPMSNEDEY